MAENQQEIQSERLPFDVEFFKRAEEFCNGAIAAVPELHGVAIVPIWQTQPQDVPSGLLRLRNPQPPYVPSLLSLLKRLAAFNMDAHGDLARQFNMYDQYAAELSRQIKERQEKLGSSPPHPQTLNKMPDDSKSIATTEINIAADNKVLQDLLANQYGRLEAGEVRAALEGHYATVWNEDEFQTAFNVRETCPPYVHVSHKETGQLGTVIYVDSPRFYFLFNPEVAPNE